MCRYGCSSRVYLNFPPQFDGAVCSGQQEAVQIMKTHHPVVTRSFFSAGNSPCVSSLLLKHCVKTQSQEVKVWREKNGESVWVTHLKISLIFLLFFLLFHWPVSHSSSWKGLEAADVQGGTWWSDQEKMFVRGSIRADWGQVKVVIHTLLTTGRMENRKRRWKRLRATSTVPQAQNKMALQGERQRAKSSH